MDFETAQINLYAATGLELDAYGESIGLPRERVNISIADHDISGRLNSPESDNHYRRRLISEAKRISTGGPAFGDFHQAGECAIKTGGMTLRDYFAAKAIPALVERKFAEDEMAEYAYAIADAMLAERAK